MAGESTMMALDFPVGGLVYVQTENGSFVPLGSLEKDGLDRDSLMQIAERDKGVENEKTT